jgi:hypothetical protein
VEPFSPRRSAIKRDWKADGGLKVNPIGFAIDNRQCISYRELLISPGPEYLLQAEAIESRSPEHLV